MNAKKFFAAFSIAMLLASCGGEPASSASGTDSGSIADSSIAPSESSSSKPASNVFNMNAMVQQFASAVGRYDKTVTADFLINKLKESGEDLELDASSETKASEAGLALTMYYALKDSLPARIGARSFSGTYFNAKDIDLRKVKDATQNGIVFKALDWLSNTGIFDVPATTSLSGGKAVVAKTVAKYIDRIHAYFGQSRTDDFFSTVNHDYLYDDNPYQDAPNDGRLSWDDEYNEDDLRNIYDSQLIPEDRIVDWALPVIEQIPSAKNFVELYRDFDNRVSGDAGGLVAGIKQYLDATTPAEFIEVSRKMAKETGFCVFWSEMTDSQYSLMNNRLLTVTCYNYADSSATATSNRVTSINRFTPIFQEALGISEEGAKKYSTDYADFKIQMASAKESDSLEDAPLLLNSNPEQVEASPTLYFNPTFSTGEGLAQFFESLGFKNSSVLFTSCQDINAIVKLVNPDQLDLVKGMAIWQMLQHYTICLPDTKAVNEWAWRPGYGNNSETLWDNKAAFYTYGMPYLNNMISNYYVETEQFEKDSATVISLLGEMKEGMLTRIQAADWLSADAKEKAAKKVHSLSYSIGGKNSDGTKLSFPAPTYKSKAEGGTLYACIGGSEKVSLETYASRCGLPLLTDFNGYVASTDPLTANAFYMPSFNGIDITLGFMAAYDKASERDRTSLLADYGWVVGHELSHGFDSNGIYYDETGTHHEEGWFLAADKDAYSTRCKNVADFYNGYEVIPGYATPGKTVLTEAIADITGLRVCMQVAEGIEGFDYEAFFTRTAKNFASYASQYTYASALAADEHPFGRARINLAFMTCEKWFDTFGAKEGDAMYVAPSDRIVIW